MKTIITVIAAVFSFTILSSCSQDYSSPTSENKSPTVTSKSETKTETKSETKTETAPAATSESTTARKTDSLASTKDTAPAAPSVTEPSTTNSRTRTSATGSSVTDDKRARSTDKTAGVAPDRTSSRDQGQTVPPGKAVGVEQITSNRMLTIEGTVLKIEGDSYLVKDLSGNEVKLRADDKTKKDGNLTVGDRILARLEGPGVAASSITKR
jgi:uncharacterized protein YdeI (BOF family)